MSIGELARLSGTAASAIRYYEKIGLLPEAPRRAGQRRYDQASVRRLQLIHAARDAGLSIASIRELFEPGPVADHWKRIVRNRIAELDKSRKLLLDLAGCRCQGIQECETALAARTRRIPS
jgi:MerR family redox-sensitive transcriptional activator SoxR